MSTVQNGICVRQILVVISSGEAIRLESVGKPRGRALDGLSPREPELEVFDLPGGRHPVSDLSVPEPPNL